MTFQELVGIIKAREAQSGNYLSRDTATSIAAIEVLEGFHYQGKLHLDEAIDYIQHLTEGRCIYTGMGFAIDAACLTAAIKIARRKKGEH